MALEVYIPVRVSKLGLEEPDITCCATDVYTARSKGRENDRLMPSVAADYPIVRIGKFTLTEVKD